MNSVSIGVSSIVLALTALLAACGSDDSGEEGQEATTGGTGTNQTGSGGASGGGDPTDTGGSAATGGSTGSVDSIFALCVTGCEKHNSTCSGTDADCQSNCEIVRDTSPQGCEEYEIEFYTCVAESSPTCPGDTGADSSDACNSDARSLCLFAEGQDCLRDSDYDNLCLAIDLGGYAYHCQLDVGPYAGCAIDPLHTDEGVRCCDAELP